MPAKRRAKSSASSDTTEDEGDGPQPEPNGEWRVERILDERNKGPKKEFYIRWEGFDEEWDTWEPRANLTNCKRKLEEFRAAQKEALAEAKKKALAKSTNAKEKVIAKSTKATRATRTTTKSKK